ncbi:hypothetical protein B0H63DRAFT_525849 [Podospora didyma]|uniref:Uncharacterized protein n=1 Tax=Podospora didyma TaxID=330526 RepID=A0AAE0KCY5_9PEZI|nr:hypothetical protein B0H63DRAFT_525849 [Podospora didyma]
MQYKLAAITIVLVAAGLTSACGAKNGACDDNGCEGINNPDDGLGYCTAGEFIGCPCRSICGSKNGPCNDNGCNDELHSKLDFDAWAVEDVFEIKTS